MATVQNNTLGVVEIAKRTNNGQVIFVSEVISRIDELWMDAVWIPANQVSAYVHTRRTSYPSGTWRKIGTGASVEVSHTNQIVDNVGTLESWCETDELTVKKLLSGAEEFLNTEVAGAVEGLGETMTAAFISSDTRATPEQFDGLQVRLGSLGTYVKGCGGSGGDTTSIYGVHWGPQAVACIYEPGLHNPTQAAPLSIDKKGLATVEDGSSTSPTRRDVFQVKFQASMGVVSHDNRDLFRLTNIEDDASGANIAEPDLLVQLMRQGRKGGQTAPGMVIPQWVLYTHSIVLTQLDILAMDKSNVLYTMGELWGEPVTMFRGAPLRQLDGIGITETAVT